MRNKKGFSLLEIILVIGILGVIGAYSSNLLTRTFQSSTKSELTGKLKINGQNALNIISETIRMSDAVVCYDPVAGSKKWIVVRDLSGKYIMFRFVDPVGTPVTQNGYIARQPDLTPYAITNPITGYCTTPNPALDPALDVFITDINLINGVSITGGEFIQVSGSFNKDTVTIKFNVNPPGNPVSGSYDVVNMQTTVQVR